MVIDKMFLIGRIIFAQLRYLIGISAVFTGIWEMGTGEFIVAPWLSFWATVSLQSSLLLILSSPTAYFAIKKKVVASGEEWDAFLQMKRSDQNHKIRRLGFNAFYFGRQLGKSRDLI